MVRAATGILVALVLAAAPASAEFVLSVELGSGHGTVNNANDPISITQNVDPTTLSNMVACGNAGCTPDGVVTCTTDNQWARVYNLDDAHSINDPFAVQSVDIGHLIAVHELGEDLSMDVNLYTLAEGMAVSYANVALIGTATTVVPGDGSASGTLQNIPVAGLVTDSNNSDLVVEQVQLTNGTVAPFSAYRAGGNGAGEFGPSYLASASCGLNDLATFASIGFGTIHLVQTVNGKVEDGSTPTEAASWGEIKSLYK
jgi:hypothetical protein